MRLRQLTTEEIKPYIRRLQKEIKRLADNLDTAETMYLGSPVKVDGSFDALQFYISKWNGDDDPRLIVMLNGTSILVRK